MGKNFTDGIFSEHYYPWSPELGVNRWAPVSWQWFCFFMIWAVALLVMFGSSKFRESSMGSFLSKWYPFLLWPLGYVIFFGFVSFSLGTYDWVNYLLNFVCLCGCIYFKVCVPYLLAAFCAPIFLFPVFTASQAQLVMYDTTSYTLGVAYPTGISNAVTFWLVKQKLITQRQRWLLQSLGWTTIMSGIPIVLCLLGIYGEYRLNLVQFIRYSAFQLSTYVFIYAGICNWLEPLVLAESGKGVLDDGPNVEMGSFAGQPPELT